MTVKAATSWVLTACAKEINLIACAENHYWLWIDLTSADYLGIHDESSSKGPQRSLLCYSCGAFFLLSNRTKCMVSFELPEVPFAPTLYGYVFSFKVLDEEIQNALIPLKWSVSMMFTRIKTRVYLLWDIFAKIRTTLVLEANKS